jgi:glycosyltransferase involved in cell wall biosynthesis
MRIGLIVYGLDRPLTGIGRYTLELARAMSALTPRPDIVLLRAGALGPLENETHFPEVQLPACALLPGLITLGNVVIPSVARRLGLDVIHDPTGVTPLLFGLGQFKSVVTIHDVFAWSCPGNSSLLDRLIYRQWLPRMAPKTNAIITVSEQSKKDIQQYLAPQRRDIKIIPYGVTDVFRPLPTEQVKRHLEKRFGLSTPYILYVGSLTRRKNIERALEAFALLRPTFPDLRFVLAGPRSFLQTPVEEIIGRLDIAEQILLTGPLTDKDLPALYNGAQLFVFPSLYEGFGLPVLEALSCGTPVITSTCSSLPEVAGEAAILVDPYDVNAIAVAMQQVLSEPKLAAEMVDAGLARAKQFSWERTAQETMAVYQGQKITPQATQA